jgi:hypothetical protein
MIARRGISILIIMNLALISGGCYTQLLLSKDSLGENVARDIVVVTKDGRRVSFSQGEYSMTSDTTGRRMLQGKGRIQPRLSAPDEPFVGTIPMEEIDSIHSPEKSTLFYVSIAAGVTFSLLFVILSVIGIHGLRVG